MIQYKRVFSATEFDTHTEAWRINNVCQFGGIYDVLEEFDNDEMDEDEMDEVVIVALDGDNCVGYLTSDVTGMWCIEVKETHYRRGIASKMVEVAGVEMVWEVCSDECAALCEKLNLEYEDCR